MNKIRETLKSITNSLQVIKDFRNPKTKGIFHPKNVLQDITVKMVTDMDTLFPIFISMMALTNSVVICCLIILSCIILIVIGVIIVAWNVMEPTKDFWFNRGLLPVIFVPVSLNICLNFTSKTYL